MLLRANIVAVKPVLEYCIQISVPATVGDAATKDYAYLIANKLIQMKKKILVRSAASHLGALLLAKTPGNLIWKCRNLMGEARLNSARYTL